MTDAEREALIRQWVDTRPAGADAYRALLRLLDEARADIAPPQAPPASAMERATQAYKAVLERMEEELPGYQGLLPLWTILDVYGRAIEQAEREARAAERERCLRWAAGSAHTAEYVVNAIESGAPPLATAGEP